MDEKFLEALAGTLESQNAALKEINDKLKTVGNSQTANQLHGVHGLFSTPGLERDVITAHIRPYGIASLLPMLPSVVEDPRFPSITGFTDVVGSEPTLACEDAPVGYMKGCNLTARFGLLRRDTSIIDIEKTMLQVNRGEMMDLMLRGRLLGMTNLTPSGLNETDVLTIMTKAEMVGAAIQAERKLNKDMWQGTVALGTFPGLDSQIATGQKDADTGVTCPALDSDIKDFNYASIAGASPDIVEYLSAMMWYLNYNAVQMGLDPVTWEIVMRPELWFELTAIWPCKYNTTKCTAAQPDGATTFLDGRDNTQERDAMRNSMTLAINGVNYHVTLDTGIYEHTHVTNAASLAAGEFASSIYIVPLTIQGGFPVTYREYLDYRAARRDSNVALLNGKEMFWTDDGIYSWAYQDNKWCYKLALRTEQRVILRSPHLAGKLQHVKYTPLQHLRDADPDDPYWVDGGVSLRNYTWGQSVAW